MESVRRRKLLPQPPILNTLFFPFNTLSRVLCCVLKHILFSFTIDVLQDFFNSVRLIFNWVRLIFVVSFTFVFNLNELSYGKRLQYGFMATAPNMRTAPSNRSIVNCCATCFTSRTAKIPKQYSLAAAL